MKALDRPSGYFQTWDPNSGRQITGETRQCVHCGTTWVYNPQESFNSLLDGQSRKIRGKCLNCYGLICANDYCLEKGCVPMMKQIEDMEKPGNILLKG